MNLSFSWNRHQTSRPRYIKLYVPLTFGPLYALAKIGIAFGACFRGGVSFGAIWTLSAKELAK